MKPRECWKEQVVRIAIAGLVRGPLVVHQTLQPNVRDLWTVSHRESGRFLASRGTREAAIKFADALYAAAARQLRAIGAGPDLDHRACEALAKKVREVRG